MVIEKGKGKGKDKKIGNREGRGRGRGKKRKKVQTPSLQKISTALSLTSLSTVKGW